MITFISLIFFEALKTYMRKVSYCVKRFANEIFLMIFQQRKNKKKHVYSRYIQVYWYDLAMIYINCLLFKQKQSMPLAYWFIILNRTYRRSVPLRR